MQSAAATATAAAATAALLCVQDSGNVHCAASAPVRLELDHEHLCATTSASAASCLRHLHQCDVPNITRPRRVVARPLHLELFSRFLPRFPTLCP